MTAGVFTLAGLRLARSLLRRGLTSVPVIAGIMSVNNFIVRSRRPDSPTAANEQQRLLALHFLNGMPGDDPKKP